MLLAAVTLTTVPPVTACNATAPSGVFMTDDSGDGTGDDRVVIVLRPTVSGLDRRSADALVDRIRESSDRDIGVAYLDIETPTIHEELDRAARDGLASITLLPVAVPRDKYLTTWTQRAVANWRETRPDADVHVRIAEPDILDALADHLASAIGTTPRSDIRASPASYRSPPWSVIEQHDRHVLVCKGPRCMAYGAGPLHRELTALSKAARAAGPDAPGSGTKVTGTGCLSPCNLGPLAIVNPESTWYGHLAVDDAAALIDGPGPAGRRLER